MKQLHSASDTFTDELILGLKSVTFFLLTILEIENKFLVHEIHEIFFAYIYTKKKKQETN